MHRWLPPLLQSAILLAVMGATNSLTALDSTEDPNGEILEPDIEMTEPPISPVTGEEAIERSSEDHMREELGVNTYTTPSIDRIFLKLQQLGPIHPEEIPRRLDDDHYTNRIQLALNFGRLIAEGFLTIQTEDRDEIESLGRKLVEKARALGVGDSVTSHSRKIIELGESGDWASLRRHLSAAQTDVEKAMLELRDEQIAHMIALGGWLRGLEIATTVLRVRQTGQAQDILADIDLVDYFNDRLSTLHPALKRTPLILAITTRLTTIQGIMEADGGRIYESDVAEIHRLARELNDAIQKPVDDWPEVTG